MKKTIYLIAVAAAFVACVKEKDMTLSGGPAMQTITLRAGFDPELKTAYDAQGKFSWMEGDRIGVVVVKDGVKSVVAFTTTESGPVVDFTGSVEEGFEVEGTATYPFTETTDGYARNDFAWNVENESAGYRLWGSIKPSLDNPLGSTPLFGRRDNDGIFQFRTAVGIVKFTVKNVPMETVAAYLEVPSESSANLNGWYNIDEDNCVKMTLGAAPYKDRYNWNAPTEANSTIDYYFFLPVGTLPVGSKFELINSSWAAIASFPLKKEIEVVRNTLVNVAPIEIEPVTIYSLQDVLGTYQMTASTGPYSENGTVGDVVIAESDDSSKGNVMMTMFAGIEGKLYGTFNGINITFPKDQLFAANPYEGTKTDYPFIALDAYSGSVVDAVFTVLGQGSLKVEQDAVGFRATTENDWYNQDHGGAWPWDLCLSEVTLEWYRDPSWQSLGKGSFIDRAIWEKVGLSEPVEVEFFTDVNHPGEFRIANPYAATGKSAGEVPEVLNLTIDGRNVSMDKTFATGIEITNSYNGTDYTWNAVVFDNPYSSSNQTVIKMQPNGLPAVVQLAPCYRDAADRTVETADDYAYEFGNDHALFGVEIVFPGAEGYDATLSGTVEDVVGTYYVISSVYSGWGSPAGEMVIAESDDAAKGNVMLSVFDGHEASIAKTYGTYSAGVLNFGKTRNAEGLYLDGNGATHRFAAYDETKDLSLTVARKGVLTVGYNQFYLGNQWTLDGSGFDSLWTQYDAFRQ